MIRFIAAFAALAMLQACSSTPATSGRIARQPDALCINDCLGAGGKQDWCESRCSD